MAQPRIYVRFSATDEYSGGGTYAFFIECPDKTYVEVEQFIRTEKRIKSTLKWACIPVVAEHRVLNSEEQESIRIKKIEAIIVIEEDAGDNENLTHLTTYRTTFSEVF